VPGLLPLDRIKIDRSFMRDLMSEPAAKAVVTSIIDLARNLGFACIAEGVETREQLQYLENKECSEVQGFLYSPAVPALAAISHAECFPGRFERMVSLWHRFWALG